MVIHKHTYAHTHIRTKSHMEAGMLPKNKFVFKCFLDNLKFFKLTFFPRGRFLEFKIFLISQYIQIRSQVIKFPIFPKFKKLQIIRCEGGSRKLWTFSHFWDIFSLHGFPIRDLRFVLFQYSRGTWEILIPKWGRS